MQRRERSQALNALPSSPLPTARHRWGGPGRAEWYYPDHQYVESWTDVSHSKAPGTESAACCAATLDDATARSTTCRCSIANTHATVATGQGCSLQVTRPPTSLRLVVVPRGPRAYLLRLEVIHRPCTCTPRAGQNTFSPGIVVHRSDSSRSTRNKDERQACRMTLANNEKEMKWTRHNVPLVLYEQ